MSGFVYIWRDRKHNKYYIGSHWGPKNDGYICSSDSMREAYRRRPEDFKRRILAIIIDRAAVFKEEQRWLNMIEPNELGLKYYNRYNSSRNIGHWSCNEEMRKKVGKKLSERIPPMLGKSHKKETKRKIGKSNQNKLKGKTWEEIYGPEKAIEKKKLYSNSRPNAHTVSGRHWFNNGEFEKLLFKKPNGWQIGMLNR